MKEIRIKIPTNKKEAKVLLLYALLWITKPKLMKKRKIVLDELYVKIRNEICSGYWNKDISEYMKQALFGRNGKITAIFRNAKINLDKED